jgi:predicted membrane protein
MLGGLMLWVEDLFLRKTNAGMAAAVGFMVSLVMWEGVFDNLYYYPVFLGGILIVARVLSAHKRHYRGINAE